MKLFDPICSGSGGSTDDSKYSETRKTPENGENYNAVVENKQDNNKNVENIATKTSEEDSEHSHKPPEAPKAPLSDRLNDVEQQEESKNVTSVTETSQPKTDEQSSLPSFGIDDPLHPNQPKTNGRQQLVGGQEKSISQTEDYKDYVARQKEVFNTVEKEQESTPWQIFSELEAAEKQSDPFAEISISEEKFQNALASRLGISQDDISKIINDMNLDEVFVEGKNWCYRRRGE